MFLFPNTFEMEIRIRTSVENTNMKMNKITKYIIVYQKLKNVITFFFGNTILALDTKTSATSGKCYKRFIRVRILIEFLLSLIYYN